MEHAAPHVAVKQQSYFSSCNYNSTSSSIPLAPPILPALGPAPLGKLQPHQRIPAARQSQVKTRHCLPGRAGSPRAMGTIPLANPGHPALPQRHCRKPHWSQHGPDKARDEGFPGPNCSHSHRHRGSPQKSASLPKPGTPSLIPIPHTGMLQHPGPHASAHSPQGNFWHY